MRKIFYQILALAVMLLAIAGVFRLLENRYVGRELPPAAAIDPAAVPYDSFFLGRVLAVERQEKVTERVTVVKTFVKARLETGSEAGREVDIIQDSTIAIDGPASRFGDLAAGDRVVIAQIFGTDGVQYFVADRYRIPGLGWIAAIFFSLAIFFGRLKGLGSVLGLLFSVAILSQYLIPSLIAGANPLFTSLIAASAIAVVSLFLAHGFRRRTVVALFGTLLTLALSAGMAVLFVRTGYLFGFGSEDAYYLQQFGPLAGLDFRGLLLGGIIIGVLGVLDDTTTIQAAAVEELKLANPSLTFGQLYQRAMSVGREHITSLVNTLVLAYAGAGLPLFLLFSATPNQPGWVTFNSEFIAEEIVRTLTGSAALILAVPITTALAAWHFSRIAPTAGKSDDESRHDHGHVHPM